MSESRWLTAAYAAEQGSFWMTYCIASGFAVVYLQAMGYTNTQLGMILAAGNILGSLLGTFLADRIDRNEKLVPGKLMWGVLLVQAAILLVLLPQRGRCAAVTVGYAAFLAVALSANSLLLKISADLTYRGTPVNYGVARGTGSLTYMLVSILLGILLERRSAQLLPLAALLFTAGQAAANVWMLRKTGTAPVARQSAGDRSGASLGRFFRENPRFTMLLLGSVLVFFAFNTVASFFINVVEHVGGTTATMGWLSAYMAGLEIPVMMGFFWFRRRWSPSALLRFSFFMFVGKAVLLALARSVPFLYVCYLLQPLSYAVYNPAIVLYVEQVIPFRDSAKGQSLVFSTTTVGAVLANLIGGMMYDRLSVSATLWIAAAVCAVGAAICIRSVQKTPVCLP